MKLRINSIRHGLVSGVFLCLFLICSPGWAVYTWDGGGYPSAIFSNAANWDPDVAPPAAINDSLAFGASVSGYNMAVNTSGTRIGIQGINFTSDCTLAYTVVTASGSFSFDSGATIWGSSTSPQQIAGIGVISNGPGGIVINSDTFNLTISCPISTGVAGGGITKSGTNTLTLSGANIYTGGTTLNAGTIVLGNNTALGTAGLTLGGNGTLQSNDDARSVSNTIANGGNTLTVSGASNLTLSGVISGLGALTTNMTANADTLTLSGANTYSGGTTLTKGTIILGNNTALGTAGLTLGGNGTLQSNDDARSVSNTIANGGFGLTVSGASNLTLSGVISGTGTLTTNMTANADTLTLSGANTYSGGTTLTKGTIILGNNAALGTGMLTLGGTSFIQASADDIEVGNAIWNAGYGLTVSGASNLTLSGVISRTGPLTVNMETGADTLTLSGTNTYSGGTTLTKGTIILGNDAALGTGALTLISSLGTLQSNNDARSVSNPIALGGKPLTISGASNLTLSGVISGAGASALTKAGAGTTTLSGINTYSGITTINAGTLSIGADSGLGTAPGGATATQITFGGGTLESSGTFTLNANRGIALTGAGTIDVDAGQTLTYGGIIAGAGTLAKADTGTLILGGNSTYTGATNINAGTLAVTANNALGTNAAGTTVADGATLDIQNTAYSTTEALTVNGGTISTSTGTSSFAGNVTLGAGSTIGVAGTQLTLSGIIGDGGGTFGLTKTGDGIAVLSGVNTYTGTTTINAGTLKVSGGAAIADTGAVSLADVAGAIFELSNSETIGSLAGGGALGGNVTLNANTLTVGDATSTTYSGVISGAGALTKAGAGTLTLSGTNAYSGGTTVTTGTLTGTTTSLQGAITNNAAVVFDQGIAGTYAGVMGGTGTLTKNGAGTLTLSGVNTYTGLTMLTAGGLILSGQVARDITVAGGTLRGAGTVGRHLTLNGGTFSPGNSIGTTTILGNYAQNAGSTLEVEVSNSGGALTSDFLDVTGSATLASGSTINILDISPSGSIIVTGDTFNIIKADGGVIDGGPTITDNSAVLSFVGGVSGNFYQLAATRQSFISALGGGGGPLAAIDSDRANASGDYITVINALTSLNSTELNNAEKQLDPLPHASATTVSLRTTQQMAGNLVNYLSARRLGVEQLVTNNTQSQEHQLLIADASSNPEILGYVIRENERIAKKQQEQEDGKISGFFRPFGMFCEQDPTPKLTGFDAKAVGTQFGFDKSFGSNLILGIGGGYSHSFINFKGNRGESNVDSFRVGPYASYFKDNFFVDSSVSFGYHKNKNERDIRFGTINRTADSDYRAYDLSAYIGGEYDFHVNRWTVTPAASFQYIRYRNEGFRETGAGAAGLDVEAATSESFRSKLGVTLSAITELYGTKIVPELFAGWAHEFMDKENIKAGFVDGAAKFTTDVAGDRDDSVYFGAGISALLKENVSAFVRYEGEYSAGNDIKTLNVGITILF